MIDLVEFLEKYFYHSKLTRNGQELLTLKVPARAMKEVHAEWEKQFPSKKGGT